MTEPTISELYGVNKIKGAKFGVEIEFETRERFSDETYHRFPWRITNDGSLRNYGWEVISRPATLKELEESVPQVCDVILSTNPLKTDRTSVHVHVNVSDLTTAQILTLYTLYLFLEGSFFWETDPNREANLFSLSTKRCGETIQLLSRARNKRNVFHSFPEGGKYTACNLASITRFGTIEFRHMPGVYNASEILKWVKTLKNFRAFGLEFSDPSHVLEAFEQPSDDFLQRVYQRVFGRKMRGGEFYNGANSSNAWRVVSMYERVFTEQKDHYNFPSEEDLDNLAYEVNDE